jgi:integrase
MSSGSAWIRSRPTRSGDVRHRVEFRLGGRESVTQFGGSFATKREATIRKAWILGELAARRVPDLGSLVDEPPALTLIEAGERWHASRFDVADSTRVQQRVSLKLALSSLGDRPVDKLTAHDVAQLVAELVAKGKAPGTIKKAVQAVAMVLDHAGVKPNPARDRVVVKLPREQPEEINPPSAEHVVAVYRRIADQHKLALLFLDWSGARVAAIDLTRIGDYDEPRRRVRLRASTTKMRRALWIDLPDVLAEAIEATLPHRRFRDAEARLFAESGADALRTAIAKSCKAEGVPVFSPHDLRHRRISLLHLSGMPWARIGEYVGQRDLAVTANTYTHVMIDEAELDYQRLLAS